MSFYYRPIIVLTLAMIAGIIAGERLPGHRLTAWCVAMGCAAPIVFSILRRKASAVLPLILFVSLGYLLIQPWASPQFPPGHIRHAATGDKSIVAGVVVSSPVVTGFRQSFLLKTEMLGGRSSPQRASGKLRVSLSGREPEVSVGDRISFVGRIRTIRSFQNPGGFDYNRYMAFQGVWATASGQGESVTVLARRIVGVDVWISPGRKSVAALIDSVTSVDSGGVLKALLVGDRSGLSDTLREAFQRAGIGHLLAISGLHVGLVAGGVFFVFFKIFGFFPELLRRAWTRKAATVPALLAIWGYAVLAGLSPSTQRAAIMASVLLAAFFVERPQDTLNSVAAAAMAILVIRPPALFSASFQLSFAAVVAIVLGLSLMPPPGPEARRRVRDVLRRRVVVFMVVSLAAILGTLPLALYYFNEISLVGLLSNLIFVPATGFGILPVGLLSVCVSPASPVLAGGGLKLCGMMLSGILWGVRAVSSLPFAAVTTVTPSMTEMALYYCLLISSGLMFHAYRTGRWRDGATLKKSRKFRCALLLLLSAAVGMALDVGYWAHQRFWTETLRVTVIDVGHGSAGLVELPGGEVILIDGGGFSDNSVFDVGRRIVAPLLLRKKIRTVRTLILSHPDSDHLNGLVYVAEHFHVARFLSNGEPADTRGYRELMAVIRDREIPTPAYERLARTWSDGGALIELLYPGPGFIDERDAEMWRGDSNNNSIVVKITLGEISFLFPGDLLAAGEEALVDIAGSRLRSRVLVAPHHGSSSSSSQLLLEKVRPEVIVASAGWDDQYGAPHPDVYERYRRMGAEVLTTAESGAVTFETDGERLRVETAVR